MSLHGRTALVTGGGRGIGAACARALAAAGARVAIAGRSEDALAAVAREIDAVAIRADLADRDDTDRLIACVAERVGAVDVLVNNAGVADSATLAATDDAMWDRMFEINATAVFRLCRALVPPMCARGWGRVVNIASTAGLTGFRYTAAYCASKHAVVGFTRALALDVARAGVTVNAVCPGWVDTDMTDRAVATIAAKTGRTPEAARAELERTSAQRRLVAPHEVAFAVAVLCDDDARGIHGQTIVVDGGGLLK